MSHAFNVFTAVDIGIFLHIHLSSVSYLRSRPFGKLNLYVS